jgi:predicted AAA+ superfamily ATPase
MKRYLDEYIKEDLETKMVFLGGPRQVGKTTVAKNFLEKFFETGRYFNWDSFTDRKEIEQSRFSPEDELIILDEIHKFRDWKNFVKGLYDTRKDTHSFFITGSARLDLYQKGGDSLMGRYHYYRLHPFSVAEMLGENFEVEQFLKEKRLSFKQVHLKTETAQLMFNELFTKGGFPEPLFDKNIRNQLRWSADRKRRLIQEDIRDVSFVKMISDFEKLVLLLPEKIGSLFSFRSLSEDISVSQPTIKDWMQILENFYYIFRLSPFASSQIKSLKKEQKVFLWDYSEVENEGSRFENLVASHLLKWVHFLQDTFGLNISLHYLRDKEKREVDFCIVWDGKIFMAIEVKLSDTSVSKHLKYFQKKMDIPCSFQVVKKSGVDFENDGVRVMSAEKFLSALV